jgi:hypothetical protein
VNLVDLRAKWEARRAEHARFDSHVSAEKLIGDFLADLSAVVDDGTFEVVSLREASLIGGYSIDRLQHLVASSQIVNVGRKGRPRIRRADVPVKPGYLRPIESASQFDAHRRIVASVTGSTAS